MCMASHIYEYTQQTTHRVATNTTRRPLFHRAPEDEDDRGAHSKAKEFILGISVCCLCFLKLVNLDLDLDLDLAGALAVDRTRLGALPLWFRANSPPLGSELQ